MLGRRTCSWHCACLLIFFSQPRRRCDVPTQFIWVPRVTHTHTHTLSLVFPLGVMPLPPPADLESGSIECLPFSLVYHQAVFPFPADYRLLLEFLSSHLAPGWPSMRSTRNLKYAHSLLNFRLLWGHGQIGFLFGPPIPWPQFELQRDTGSALARTTVATGGEGKPQKRVTNQGEVSRSGPRRGHP